MVQLFWKNATSKVVGEAHGITREDLTGIDPLIRQCHAKVRSQIAAGLLGYADLPHNTTYRAQVQALVSRYKPNTTDMLVLGIGGSALGSIALHSALTPSTYNLITDRRRGGPRLFVLDNVDPSVMAETFKFVSRRATSLLVNVISKGGETAETAAQFMIVRELLRRKLGDDFAQRVVVTTDPNEGTLRDIAHADRCAMLPVPGDVGGRFSVLSSVGLFSAAMCGIDIDAVLAGAASMAERCSEVAWQSNPATMLAVVKYLAFVAKGKPMHVMMPYSNRLYMLADWYRQLWAESLGKRVTRDGYEVCTGPTPIKALGATDQHSQIQLYREGPNDKLTVFLEVKKHPQEIRVPETFADKPGRAYLGGKKISTLLNAEKVATEFAMSVSQRPTVSLKFDAITPESVGEFIFLYEYTTSLMGEMLNINAYDQPAVELGKLATFALMGREGYGDMAQKIKPFTRASKRHLA